MNFLNATSTGVAADFTLSSTITFYTGDGDGTVAPLALSIPQDKLVEGNELLRFDVVSGGGGITIGTNSTVDITVNDKDSAKVDFTADDTGTTEVSGTYSATVELRLTPIDAVVANPIVVRLGSVGGGTATLTSDYTVPATTQTFAAGATHLQIKALSGTVVNDATAEPEEAFAVSLQITSGPAVLGPTLGGNANFTITDNDCYVASSCQYLVVSDVATDALHLGRTNGTYLKSFYNPAGAGVSPRGMVRMSGGTVAIAFSNGTVKHWNPVTNVFTNYTTPTQTPTWIATANYRLWTVGRDALQVISGSTTNYASAGYQSDTQTSLAALADGTLYAFGVPDAMGGNEYSRIWKFNNTGAEVPAFSAYDLGVPGDLAIDGSGNVLATVEDGFSGTNGALFRLNPTSGSRVTLSTPVLANPRGLDVDPSGNIWLVESEYGVVYPYVYKLNGTTGAQISKFLLDDGGQPDYWDVLYLETTTEIPLP